MTWGWQRREYGSWTLSHFSWERAISLLAVSSSRYAAATSTWPRWPRAAWMRASNGAREPSMASTLRLPQTVAAANRSSASNNPRRA